MIGIGTVIDLGRGILGSAAKVVGSFPSFDRKYHINRRLDGPWPEGPCLWLHGASLGECKVLLNLAELLRRDLPNCPRILLTTQKVEVVPVLEKMGEGLVDVSIAPADTPASMSKFIRKVQPQTLILAENELWPGYLSSMSRTSLKPSVALVSGRFRKAFPGIDFSSIGFACMQTEADRQRISESALSSKFWPMVGGDWKIISFLHDNPTEHLGARESETATGEGSKDVDLALLSVHFPEWEALSEIIRVCKLRNKSVVLMPRRLEEVELFRQELQINNVKVVEWPQVRQGGVTLIDQFGLTGQILERARQSLVGGSFCPKPGIHDFWEPLLAKVPTCVGPYAGGHEDLVEELVQEGAIARLSSASDFENLDLVDEKQMQGCLDLEKEKVSDSYQQLLRFLEDLLK